MGSGSMEEEANPFYIRLVNWIFSSWEHKGFVLSTSLLIRENKAFVLGYLFGGYESDFF